MKKREAARSIDDYIAAFPADRQKTLESLRAAIRAAAPDAVERISYGMPAFYQGGNLVYFAVFKDHIGFFPTSNGVAAFKHDLASYRISKGTIRFPLDEPLPLKLVGRIVRFRVAQNKKKRARQPAGSMS